jgi:hypothetical protein
MFSRETFSPLTGDRQPAIFHVEPVSNSLDSILAGAYSLFITRPCGVTIAHTARV